MEKSAEMVMDLCREPMLAVEDGRAAYLNAAAREAFPGLAEGAAVFPLLPSHILSPAAERFTAAVTVGGTQYTAACGRLGDAQLIALSASAAANGDGMLSDGLMAGMLSALFNIGLAVRRVAALFPEEREGDAERFLSILRHGYFDLRRQLDNLNAARLLREGQLRFSPRRTELVSFCAALAETVDDLTRPGHAALRFSSAVDGELWASVDSELVERMLLNLLVNSFQHTPPDGTVRLRLARSGGSAVLSVDDNGEGIPDTVLRNIFTRYEQRLDGEHLDRGSGGGLGLGVASALAKVHGGALIIESRAGHGTSVRAMLPLEAPGGVLLEDGGIPEEARGMDGILTALSGILGPEYYTEKYLD